MEKVGNLSLFPKPEKLKKSLGIENLGNLLYPKTLQMLSFHSIVLFSTLQLVHFHKCHLPSRSPFLAEAGNSSS